MDKSPPLFIGGPAHERVVPEENRKGAHINVSVPGGVVVYVRGEDGNYRPKQ